MLGKVVQFERVGFELKGKILGQEVTLLATFWVMERPQGGMFSTGHHCASVVLEDPHRVRSTRAH
jgi:hypothetical protein